MATSTDAIQNLITKKTDFVVMDEATANAYLKANPGSIKATLRDQPMTSFPTTMLLPAKDFALKAMIDNIFRDMELDGTVDDVLKKYKMDKVFLRNPKPVAPAQ